MAVGASSKSVNPVTDFELDMSFSHHFMNFAAACASVLGIHTHWGDRDRDHIDLLVNGKNNPEAVVTLDDLKPGDERIVTKKIYVKSDESAKIWLKLKNLSSSQGTQTEPEDLEENGTPKFDIQNYIKYDLKLKDKVIISLDDGVHFPSVFTCWIPVGTVPKKTTVNMYQSFHFDPSVTNWAQGDQTLFTEEFMATDADSSIVPESNGYIWDPITKKCITKPTPTPTIKKPTPTPKPSTPTPTKKKDKDDDKNKNKYNNSRR